MVKKEAFAAHPEWFPEGDGRTAPAVARALRSNVEPSLTRCSGRTEFVVPRLKDYEVVVLEP
jgi:hypothetical protein